MVSSELLLHDAAVFGHKEIAELLIAAGVDVNANGIIGWTPLFEPIHPLKYY